MDFVTKVDHTFNESHSAFVRYYRGYQNTYCDQVNGGEPAFPGTTCFVDTTRDPYNWAGNYRWRRARQHRQRAGGRAESLHIRLRQPDGGPLPILLDGRAGHPPGRLSGRETFESVDTLQFVDNLSWLKGSHSFHFGTNMRFQRHTDTRGSVGTANVAPTLNFSRLHQRGRSCGVRPPGGHEHPVNDRPTLQSNINFLLGRVGSLTQGFIQQGDAYGPGGTLFDFKADYPEIDFYAQDTWKPRSNVTVDLGLRYEAKLSPSNPDDLIRRPNQSLAVGEPCEQYPPVGGREALRGRLEQPGAVGWRGLGSEGGRPQRHPRQLPDGLSTA